MSKNKRLVLITGYPVGLGGALYHVINGIYFAVATSREPFVFWDRYRCLYVDRTIEQAPGHNYFEDFFEPVSDARLDDFTDVELKYFPPVWTGKNFLDTAAMPFSYGVKGNPECVQGLPTAEEEAADVVVFSARLSVYDLIGRYPPPAPYREMPASVINRCLARDYLRLKPSVLTMLREAHELVVGSSPYIAAHIRATDMPTQSAVPGPPQFIPKIREALRARPDHKIFLATDSTSALERVNRAFPGRVVFHDVERSNSSAPIHQPSGDGRTRAIDFLKDCYTASRGSVFIGTPHSSLAGHMQEVVGEALPPDRIIWVEPTLLNVLHHKRVVMFGRWNLGARRFLKRTLPPKIVSLLKAGRRAPSR